MIPITEITQPKAESAHQELVSYLAAALEIEQSSLLAQLRRKGVSLKTLAEARGINVREVFKSFIEQRLTSDGGR